MSAPCSVWPAVVSSLILTLSVCTLRPAIGAATTHAWPRQVLGSGAQQTPFVSNAVCAECHPQQVQEWRGSHHDQAMQAATPTNVLGNFDNASFTAFGVTSRFFKKGEQFFINTEGGDGQPADFAVAYTFGVSPLQQYLLVLPNGRLQAFTIAWDTDRRRWFHLYPDEKIPPNDPLHWTQRRFTWNSSCAECHSTNLQLNYDLDSKSYTTSWSAINVSCQACHGPGGQHVEWANTQRASLTVSPSLNVPHTESPTSNTGVLVDYQKLDVRAQVDTCARCHARRYPMSAHDQHGQPFLDDFMPELLRQDLYHSDGQILDEVYVYGSFIQSKMYQQGVGCLDCHNPHTLQLRQQGTALCTTCHSPTPPTQKFAGLKAKNYAAPAHHFHSPDSAGAQCVSCHMPTTTYMIVDPRHDHRFSIPRPDVSVQLGTENACNQCHTDKTAAWAAAALEKWYRPTPSTQRQAGHFAETIAAGRSGATSAVPALIQLTHDSQQAAIVRATAVDLLHQYSPTSPAATSALIAVLSDPAPLVRATAVQGLGHVPDKRKIEVLAPLLTDPIRAVRIQAAHTFSSVPVTQLSAGQRSAFEAALREYTAAQLAQPDQPEGHANLGRLYTLMNQPSLAEQAYKTALAQDAGFYPAAHNLAHLYDLLDRKKDAEQVLRRALSTTPDQGILHYSLGLLLIEQSKLEEAASHLETATQVMPDHLRLHYNYGLLLQKLGQPKHAESVLLTAYGLDASDPDVLYALVLFYMKHKRWKESQPYLQQLAAQSPQEPAFQQLLTTLKKRIGKKE
jgi:predicted CXXCH cytochrome family protein